MSAIIDELFEVGLAEALERDTTGSISESMLRTEGTDWNKHLRAGAAMGAEVYFQVIDRFSNGTFLDNSRFEALARWVADRYAIQKLGATSAVVNLTFSRTTTVAAVTVPAGTIVTDTDGTVQFATDVDLELAIGVSSGSVEATSVAAGRDQVAAADALTVIVGTLPQADMTVTNTERAAGGNDAETDAELRSRARGIFINARRGTVGAIAQGCLEVPQVRNASVYEYRHPNGCQTGIVGVVISDQQGNCNSSVVALVEQELESWRSAGIRVVVESATAVLRAISVQPYFGAGQATPGNKRLIQQTVAARVNALKSNAAESASLAPPDSWLTPGIVEQATLAVSGVEGIVAVLDPAGIEKPGSGERFMTTEALVTVV